MKFTVELDPVQDPDAVGEMLRAKFFVQDPQKLSFGCYSSFELQPGVRELPETPAVDCEEDRLMWHNATLDGIVMSWYWDGDGVLKFTLPDGSYLINTDCKKPYDWYFCVD